MSSKADKLLEQQGKNIGQSIAKGGPAAPASRREVPAREIGVKLDNDAFEIETFRIMPDPDQPRRDFDPEKIKSMAASLKARGQKQPILVRFSESEKKWMIVSGERRWRGATMAGIPMMKVIERKGPPDTGEILLDQLVENMERLDLSAPEKAAAFRTLMDVNNWTQAELASHLGIMQSNVAEHIALLSLPEEIQEAVKLEEISASTAYELGKVKDPEEQKELAAAVVSQGLTRAETRERVRKAESSTARGPKGKGKGRGTKAGAKPALPKTWDHKDKSTGFTLAFKSRKGYRPSELVEFLRTATERAEQEARSEAVA